MQDETTNKEGHVRWGEGFLLMYSVTDRRSYEEVAAIKGHLDEVKKARHVSTVLAANKCDLEHLRQVSTAEGEQLAQELACAFYEVSACRGDEAIREAFHELVREVRRRKAVESSKTQRRRNSIQQVKQVLNKTFTKINSRQ